MMKVYVCSPYRAGDSAELDRNIEYAQALTRQALKAGLAPITPHLYMTQCLDERKPQERAQGLAADLALLKGCDFCDCRRQVWYQRGYAPGDRNGRQAGYFCSERREAGRGKKTDRQAAGAGGK